MSNPLAPGAVARLDEAPQVVGTVLQSGTPPADDEGSMFRPNPHSGASSARPDPAPPEPSPAGGPPPEPTPSRGVTVIIPTHDRPDMIQRSVATALAQTGVDARVVVVDDGSATPAADVLPDDPRLRIIRVEQSGGVARARNLGIHAADTEWTAFLDDDDLWAPDKLSRQIDAMTAEGTQWSCTGNVRLDGRLDPVGVWVPDPRGLQPATLRRANAVATPSSVVISTALLQGSGGFDPAFSSMADWELWLRIIDDHQPSVICEPLVGYVVHDQSMHRQNTRHLFRELHQLRRKHGAIGGPDTVHWIARTRRMSGRTLSSLPLYAMVIALHPRRAAHLARGALRVQPSTPAAPLPRPEWVARWAPEPGEPAAP